MSDRAPGDDPRRPEWASDEAGSEFASRVIGSAERGGGGPRGEGGPPHQRRRLEIDEHVEGVLSGDRTVLARTITLVESDSPAHLARAQEVLRRLLPHAGGSIRIGVTGVPGVGKSTFIEALGTRLLDRGHRVAVLAIDPSSRRTRGSILGDKTRMETLGRDPRCFIRPSPTGGALGGVARKTRESIAVCEAAGHDVVLVETVGVGQSEVEARSMVDFFLLLLLAGAGDELQGIKRGVMELADALCINKADGPNRERAAGARAEYERALHFLPPATRGWTTVVRSCSSLSGEGIDEVWEVVERFRERAETTGALQERRRRQALDWMRAMLEEKLVGEFFADEEVKKTLPGAEREVAEGRLPVTAAVQELLAARDRSIGRAEED
ncbi:MAG: methylmalonyl Co-A mutase-associated GTPase MeaB [Polyangia bacterium]